MKLQTKSENTTSKETVIDGKLDKQLRELVVARLSVIPKNLQIAVGSSQYTVEELVKSVRIGNDVGNQLVVMQVQYLKDLASGGIYKELNDQQQNSTYNQT